MLKYWLHWLLFGMTMTFAAADAGLAEMGGGNGGGDDAGAGVDSAGSDQGNDAADGSGAADRSGAETQDDSLALDADADQQAAARITPDEKELSEYKATAAQRLAALQKKAPELKAIFDKNPEVRDSIARAFRLSSAMSELGSIAEMRALRDRLPNGLQDLEALTQDVQEIEQTDKLLYARDEDGNYSGHATLIQNLYDDDPQAVTALFRSVPKLWAKIDPESYQEVMSQIVGATLNHFQIGDWLSELRDVAKEAKQDGIAKELDKLARWAQSFTQRKAAPSEEEQRLAGERAKLDREKAAGRQQDQKNFSAQLGQNAQRVQFDIIKAHPAMQRIEKLQSLTRGKKNEILEKVHDSIRKTLLASPSVMRKIKAAFDKRDMNELLALHKAAWSNPLLLNRAVRQVLAKETPAVVEASRSAVRRPQTNQRTETDRAQKRGNERTGPYQEKGVWFHKDGRKMSTGEILRGAHLAAS